MLIVKTFCCGCSLKSGVVTAAVLTFIGVFFNLFNCGLAFHEANQSENSEKYDEVYLFRVAGVFNLVSACFGILVFFSIIMALIKRQTVYLLLWLSCQAFDFVLDLLTLILMTINKDYTYYISLPYMIFSTYIWVVVYSYYREMKTFVKLNGSNIGMQSN